MDKLVEYLCIIQARLNSSRLPGKVMLDLAGKTLLERVYETVSQSKKIDKIIIATSIEATDNIIEKKLESLNIDYFRGSLDNVLKRFYKAGENYNAKNIVRITADNPLMDYKVIDNLIKEYESHNVDYAMFSNGIYGLTSEVFSYESLKFAYKNTHKNFDQEHVTPFIKNNFKTHIVDIESKYRKPKISVTIDTLDDYIKMQNFYLYCREKNIIATIDTFLESTNNEK